MHVVARRTLVPFVVEIEHSVGIAQHGDEAAVGALCVAEPQRRRYPTFLVRRPMGTELVDVATGRQQVMPDAARHVFVPRHSGAGKRGDPPGVAIIKADHAAIVDVVGARVLDLDALDAFEFFGAAKLRAANAERDDVAVGLGPVTVGLDQQIHLAPAQLEALLDRNGLLAIAE